MGKKKANRKPGWEQAQKEEAEWLAKIQAMKLFDSPGRKYKGAKVKVGLKTSPVVNTDSPTIVRPMIQGKSYVTPGGSTGREYVSAEVLYKGNNEMVLRELQARMRRFNTAPAYNKGGDVYVTEESLAEQLAGNKRRS